MQQGVSAHPGRLLRGGEITGGIHGVTVDVMYQPASLMVATAHAGRIYKQCSLTDSSGGKSFVSDGVYSHYTSL